MVNLFFWLATIPAWNKHTANKEFWDSIDDGSSRTTQVGKNICTHVHKCLSQWEQIVTCPPLRLKTVSWLTLGTAMLMLGKEVFIFAFLGFLNMLPASTHITGRLCHPPEPYPTGEALTLSFWVWGHGPWNSHTHVIQCTFPQDFTHSRLSCYPQ